MNYEFIASLHELHSFSLNFPDYILLTVGDSTMKRQGFSNQR